MVEKGETRHSIKKYWGVSHDEMKEGEKKIK